MDFGQERGLELRFLNKATIQFIYEREVSCKPQIEDRMTAFAFERLAWSVSRPVFDSHSKLNLSKLDFFGSLGLRSLSNLDKSREYG